MNNELKKIRSKIALGMQLTKREKCFYLVYATDKEVEEFLKNKKGGENNERLGYFEDKNVGLQGKAQYITTETCRIV